MKILQVCSAESLGGGERHVIDLTRALIERGHDLHLAVRPGSPLRDELPHAAIKWHELSLRNALDVISARALASIIRQHNIDVMHAHVGRDYTFCGIAARMANRNGNQARSLRFFITRHHFYPIKSNPVYAWTLGEARALIAVSDSVREQLVDAFPKYADRVVVVPNWIDAQSNSLLGRNAAREAFGLHRRWAVAVIGQLTPLKQQEMFVSAAAKLIKDRHWTDADFLVIGQPGSKEEDVAYANRLCELVNTLGLEERIRFTGFVSELPAKLPAFDVVVVPSQNEAFSLALIEAMAAGCAVIASRVGGMAEIIEHEVTGLFLDRNDDTSLLAAMSRLLTDNHLRQKMGSLAQASVTERFEREHVIDRIEKLYQMNSEPAMEIVK
ncbi:MAG TPA: glycosyltransferase family 4 protein [Blastocatellia bacterium]|nr:glycosyltransferase family 4 protein [Blastocatellia bacterium]HMV81917.1 glycosyltransferase family 4 protein [Blastocatellia bacterium]HMX26363.1 glycosyltransferase family 4 protein [Blastocatellia bacterium]HMY75400.1 glycosyltransferase family 4 protein [Blastocatellia bacterium]HMZ16389.1 glycosyltransferase family 4 protein [Blastocatellia bacterium]